MELELELTYRVSKVGMAVITLYEGRNLKGMDTMGKQDPYARGRYG